jgi:hypothetical protein
MGDLNAHHPLWYGHGGDIPIKDLRQNTPFNSIAEWFENFGFLLNNEPGDYTHFPRAESFNPSVLDLCLLRGGIMHHIETWTIDRNSGSDHAIVEHRLDVPTQGITTQHIQHSRRTRLRWHKADWKKFDMLIKDSGLNFRQCGGDQSGSHIHHENINKSSGGSGSKGGNTSKTSPMVVPES